MKDRLVIVKTRTGESGKESDCDACVLDNCEDGYNYKLVEEPEEIQSEYDHKKERYDLLKRNPAAEPFWEELDELENWLKDNPKECLETCTKENTNVGDEVFLINGNYGITRKVDFIFRCGMECVLTFNDTGGQAKCRLSDYEINTNKQGDE